MKTKQESTKKISTEEFDRRFDAGEDLSEHLDAATFRRPGLEIQRTTLDLPQHMIRELDYEAALRGITRQSLIKMWLYERLTPDVELLDFDDEDKPSLPWVRQVMKVLLRGPNKPKTKTVDLADIIGKPKRATDARVKRSEAKE
jgi:hypothetical protein